MSEHLLALRKRVTDSRARLVAIHDEAGDKPLTAEQQTEWNTITAALKVDEPRLEQAETAERLRVAGARPAGEKPIGTGVSIIKENAEDAPFGDTPQRAFAAYLKAVRQSDPRLGIYDPRLRKLTAAPSGTNEGMGSDGGFLVEDQVVVELNKVMFASAELASRCQRVEIGEGQNGMTTKMIAETSRAAGSRWGGVQTYWAAEADTVTATKPKFREVDAKLQKLMGIWYCTSEELEDVSYIASVATQAFGEELAFTLDEAIFRGTGAGQPQGILNSPALVSVAKETGQAAATIEYENITKMWSRLPAASRTRAIWLTNPNCDPQLFGMSLGIGAAGVPVFLPPGGASAAPYGTIFGRPVVPNEHSNTLGIVGDITLFDGGWYRIIVKGGIVAATSIHVRFVWDESAFRFTYRVNGLPMLASAITPAQSSGADHISPFVALATRA